MKGLSTFKYKYDIAFTTNSQRIQVSIFGCTRVVYPALGVTLWKIEPLFPYLADSKESIFQDCTMRCVAVFVYYV